VVARHVDVRERWFRIREVEADMSLQYCDRHEEFFYRPPRDKGSRKREGRSGEMLDARSQLRRTLEKDGVNGNCCMK
jgi:hypothetical protein